MTPAGYICDFGNALPSLMTDDFLFTASTMIIHPPWHLYYSYSIQNIYCSISGHHDGVERQIYMPPHVANMDTVSSHVANIGTSDERNSLPSLAIDTVHTVSITMMHLTHTGTHHTATLSSLHHPPPAVKNKVSEQHSYIYENQRLRCTWYVQIIPW